MVRYHFIYYDLNILTDCFKKCLLLLLYLYYKHKNCILLCNHNLNTGYKKNMDLTFSKFYKSFSLKISFNTVIMLCIDLKININLFL